LQVVRCGGGAGLTDAWLALLQNDEDGLKDHVEHDKKGLKKIAGLSLSEEQVKALLEWKHKH
jgi:ribosomal protein S15P/S13E